MPASGQGPRPGIDNAAAFARLYGVVRYFIRADAAATLDWNRFAVYGIAQLRAAGTLKPSSRRCRRSSAPSGRESKSARNCHLQLRREALTVSSIAWRYLGAGIGDSSVPGPYRGKRTRRAPVSSGSPGIDGFATVMQTVPAMSLRGRTIRFADSFGCVAKKSAGAAALWLRIDRPDQQMGFFDNMGNRPIRDPEWKDTPSRVRLRKMRRASRSVSWPSASSRQTSSRSNSPCELRWLLDADRHRGRRIRGRKRRSRRVEESWYFDERRDHAAGRAAPEGRQFLRMSPRSSSAPTARQQSTRALRKPATNWRPRRCRSWSRA